MSTKAVENWLTALGYVDELSALHRFGNAIPEHHAYAVELRTLLDPHGAIQARAVFDVEGVPTVVFVGGNSDPTSEEDLDALRQRIWNQNLVSVVIDVYGDAATALAVRKLKNGRERLDLAQALWDGPFSALDVASGNIVKRKPDWFDIDARVDHELLENLSVLVGMLVSSGYDAALPAHVRRRNAELLTGQLLFISYLEHRKIVGDWYRAKRRVQSLHYLVSKGDRSGIRSLIDALRSDFNGDFLADDRHDAWLALDSSGFALLDSFLKRTELRTGQGSLWNYDFSFIPVELLSGLYESFLKPDEQARHGAYYTPRHLAVLTVEQAFATCSDPLTETIFDAACGSGILLTTAYRRLLALAESRAGRQLTFIERTQLLRSHIFGADINFMACRVTAFSLYLSLLEDLDPSDIAQAQEVENAKLPKLEGTNLHAGESGDFFSPRHGFIGNRFSLIISNPPWSEPQGGEVTGADQWATSAGIPFARRQIAGAFLLRSLEFLIEGGRVCMILPIGQFLGESSVSFVRYTLGTLRPIRLINLGDLQNLLFPNTEHTCNVFVAASRGRNFWGKIPAQETFDYLIPKADLSLAYGRLTMHSADRHRLQSASIAESPQLLVTFMWGDSNDVALYARLAVRGLFQDFWKGQQAFRRWTNRKGVHLHDSSRVPVDAETLRQFPFLPVSALRVGSPLLHPTLLERWPSEQYTVANISDSLMSVFDGPRVLFPDGFSKLEHSLRAVYFDGRAAFTHSIGVISGPPEDRPLLMFAAVYLRSTLARYFLTIRAWKMLCERNSVHLADVEAFPFFDPSRAPNPDSARDALNRVAQRMKELSALSAKEQPRRYEQLADSFDDDVFLYFSLDEEEKALVRETVRLFMPSIRPRSVKNLYTPAQQPAVISDLDLYGHSLADSLTSWRDRLQGDGSFIVEVIANGSRDGAIGIVCITCMRDIKRSGKASSVVDPELARAVVSELRLLGLSLVPGGNALQLVPDTYVWTGEAVFVVRPLTKRSWTIRQALRDAEYIVRAIQAKQPARSGREVA